MNPPPYYSDQRFTVHQGDCLDVMRELPDASVDAIVTDPPYGLEFMGKDWDGADGFRRSLNAADAGRDSAFGRTSRTSPEYRAGKLFQDWCELWATECLRVLKPGGHMLAFGGTRTWHRLVCAVEDAGFEIRDSIAWMYGQGFPKSRNVSAELNGKRCQCEAVDLTRATTTKAEHGLSSLRSGDVPTPEGVVGGAGPVLLAGLPEHGSPVAGRSELPSREDGAGEPSMERRGDIRETEGELHRAALREVPFGVASDGSGGRLRDGAPAGHGAVGRAGADAAGVREPHRPQPSEQRAVEPGVVSDECGPQARGVWPVCERCAKPVVPDGLGTALKPAFEPICVARKPLVGTVAANVQAYGTGALNIDACRIGDGNDRISGGATGKQVSADEGYGGAWANAESGTIRPTGGRWPANVVLDESQAEALDEQSGERRSSMQTNRSESNPDRLLSAVQFSSGRGFAEPGVNTYNDSGGASRFFYTAKADAGERIVHDGTAHPTVKPLALMRWLVRLVTPPDGTVLEPFAGSGPTVEACLLEGFRCVAIERGGPPGTPEANYLPMIVQRINRRRDPIAYITAAGDDLGLFGD